MLKQIWGTRVVVGNEKVCLEFKQIEHPWWYSGQESACRAEDMGLVPGLGRFHMLESN